MKLYFRKKVIKVLMLSPEKQNVLLRIKQGFGAAANLPNYIVQIMKKSE